jgi:hypothetical protein
VIEGDERGIIMRFSEIIYADCDRIFVKKLGATIEDCERLARDISEYIELPMVLDHHYKFLILLPLEADPSGNVEAQKHYFGILYMMVK